MPLPLIFLKCVGKAVAKYIGNQLGFGVGGDVAADIWESWCKERAAQERVAEMEALAQAAVSVMRVAVAEVVQEVAGDKLDALQQAVANYLLQIPAAVRRTLRRPADPSGRTAPPAFRLEKADDLLPLLPERTARFRPGDRPLPGVDWELEELLGVGGFGEVWKARNPHFDAMPPVALKFCLDPAAKDRLLHHEAAVLNQVMRQGKRPGIVALEHTYLSADPPCLEYEFIAGGDLACLIREWHKQPLGRDHGERVLRAMHALATTMAYAHRLRPAIVHRDLKPANILVEQEAGNRLALRIADFGIGGVMAEQAIARTRVGASRELIPATALRGAYTPLYASPQQIAGGPPDPRDDVHALGVIWLQMLTGQLSAGRPSGTRWMQRLQEQEVPAEAVALLAACVEEDPADRPADAGELAERLAELLPAAPAVAAAQPVDPPITRGPQIETLKAIANSIGMRLMRLPAGPFLMGSPDPEPERSNDEGPRHRVTITRLFYIDVYPLTQQAYAAVMGSNPAEFIAARGGGPNHPVEQVSWDDAVEFCRRLSALPAEVRSGRRYRLPTEAEWEYACRAGAITASAFGDALGSERANFDGHSPYGGAPKGKYLQRTTPVGSYPSNAWGLYDMHGNVWEWCADWYGERYYGRSPGSDPAGPDDGDKRVVRGGSWNNNGRSCRSANRYKYKPSHKSGNVGFRVVAELAARD